MKKISPREKLRRGMQSLYGRGGSVKNEPDGTQTIFLPKLINGVKGFEVVQTAPKKPKLRDCPKCNSNDLTLDSSRALQLSQVICNNCGHKLYRECYEEDIIEAWNAPQFV